MTSIGIDVGSTYTKYCVYRENEYHFSAERTPVRQYEFFDEKMRVLKSQYPDCKIVSCGYGKRNIESIKSVTELTALAVGLDSSIPEIDIALDIGGQDTKIIRQNGGKLTEFFINDKCAAGSGLFLTSVLNILGMKFEDIDMHKRSDIVRLSTRCAVFAQSEIIELIASGVLPERIASATMNQIFIQAKTLLGKLACGDVIALSGGLTKIKGIQAFAESHLLKRVIIPNNADYLSALGCAIIGNKERV